MNMGITDKHNNQYLINQTLNWFDLDNEKNWVRNMQDPEKRDQLLAYGFDHPGAFTYQINSNGFRGKNFSQDPGFIALGCSFTSGIGLPESQVWPTIVGKELNLNPCNLGIGGCGLDTCFRMLVNYIDKLNPRFVMLLIPDSGRFEIHHQGTPWPIMYNSNYLPETIATVKKMWLADEQNSIVNHTKNMLAIRQLCQDRMIKLISKPLYPTLLGTRRTNGKWPASRDLVHVGYAEQQHCAQQFLNDL